VENWYCSINGQQYGPVSKDELLSWIQQGRVTAADSVWCEGMAEWAPAGNVTAFMGRFPQAGHAAPAPGAAPGRRRYVQPHRGAAVLTLGILGLTVCCICGIIAWTMGNADLQEMAAGRMDRSGEGMTVASRICGMIGVILTSVVLVFYLLVFMSVAASH